MNALEAARDQLVVIGGTAHRLFPLHPLGRDPGFALLATEDVDLAASLELQYDRSRDLLDRLLEAGFTEEVRGAEGPAFIYPSKDHAPTYLQFVASLTGSGKARSTTKNRLMRFSGIHAEKLRHVGLLLHSTWDVQLSGPGVLLHVRVANPTAFIVQKLLKLGERPPAKRAKDLLYLFDTLAIFGGSLDELGAQSEALLPGLSRKAMKTLRGSAETHCFHDGPTAQEASNIAQQQRLAPPSALQIAAACRMALPRMLPGLL